MGLWQILFNSEGRETASDRPAGDRHRLLPAYAADPIPAALPSKEVTKIALRLRYQVEQIIPCELEENVITSPNSRVITASVVQAAKQAAGEDLRGCVPFCLLVCVRWFKAQAGEELWDSDLHQCRALACEVIAKRIIEGEENEDFLLIHTLLKRYSIFVDGEDTAPANVIERAVDLHALEVIGSSGYQKCIRCLWNGWFWQDGENTTNFVPYPEKDNTSFAAHFHPDRMRTPSYQKICQILFSLVYLGLYTQVINTVNPSGNLDVVEGILYVMTLAFICDELAKLWKIGMNYFDFWNALNSTMYTILAISFFLRMAALTHSSSADDSERQRLNELSYNFLAFSGPMFWIRMILYLDSIRFFGVMVVVLRVMMKESLIFFALLFVVLIGFFQAFIGMAQASSDVPITKTILVGMANSVMQSPEFGLFEEFAFPFGMILYYVYNFIVMIILLNILIALYNSAYEDISGNANDEYMAVFAKKTIQFIRAPDENVFIPPFNLLEIVFLILPFEWWLPRQYYARLNDIVMGIIYSPILVVTAYYEARDARRIRSNRRRGEEDDDHVHEWEHVAGGVDFDLDCSWKQVVEDTTPKVLEDSTSSEIAQLKKQISDLTDMIKSFTENSEPGVPRDEPSSAVADGE